MPEEKPHSDWPVDDVSAGDMAVFADIRQIIPKKVKNKKVDKVVKIVSEARFIKLEK